MRDETADLTAPAGGQRPRHPGRAQAGPGRPAGRPRRHRRHRRADRPDPRRPGRPGRRGSRPRPRHRRRRRRRALPAFGLPTDLAADLIGRRPDIVAARWRAEAAAHRIGEAKAAFYPDVNLAGLLRPAIPAPRPAVHRRGSAARLASGRRSACRSSRAAACGPASRRPGRRRRRGRGLRRGGDRGPARGGRRRGQRAGPRPARSPSPRQALAADEDAYAHRPPAL